MINNTLLQTAIQASTKAGDEILNIYNTEDFGVELKGDNSPLTKADKAAHYKILEYLEKTEYPILSEEGKAIPFDERKKWNTLWIVDPLDGTKEFIKRNGEFTVNIALVKNGIPILGVVYVPVTEELFYADKKGSFKTTKDNYTSGNFAAAIKLPLTIEKTEFVVVGSRSHMSEETEAYIDKLDKKGKPLKMISKGISLKKFQVAEGIADCYPRLGPTMEWDTAAGHAIALFAGKTINVYPEAIPLMYNKENLLNPYFIVQ
jgi:3'(2'), 5'-bisphosphate nucleotidase